MKSKVLISRFALSTFLLSAVAFPSVTNADGANTSSSAAAEAPKLIAVSEIQPAPVAVNELNAVSAAPVSAVEITASTRSTTQAAPAPVIMSFTSPVELAERYASDTVEDWKTALEKYDTLVQKHSTVATYTYSPVSTVPVPVAPTLVEAVEVTSSEKGTPITDVAKPAQISEVGVVRATEPAPVPTLQPVSIAVLDEADATVALNRIEAVEAKPAAAATFIAHEAGTVTIQSNDSDLTFVKAEIALAKAAETKDTDKIKNALSELMAQYQIQIAELEQSSK
ncbi:hypothetical protein H8B09_16305 [Paenibacillus sp. PR3]|uniref:Uncharacterized protein n=1 Tax=Paenibacillus terricola TaxID=2763503 RepID=A0ABR8MYB8_9BACL|nr:hypothetical protein [Paenibacillus terricola]MBD3920326.1 hypothetical protein [Paenibacillus terricola]